MTYIEFFDPTCIENICAGLTDPPERIILLGSERRMLEKQAKRYASVMLKHGFEVEFICKSVNRNDIQNVTEALSEIITTYDDCVFDLIGGDDIFLVAAGIVFERYREKNIQMHRFNIANNTIHDCDSDGKTISESDLPLLTVEDNILIYGGDVVYESTRPGATPLWNMTEDFIADTNAMWEVCRTNVKLWNAQINILSAMEQFDLTAVKGLTTAVPLRHFKAYAEQNKIKYFLNHKLLAGLQERGLLQYRVSDAVFSVTYKSAQIKKCLTKAGQALEMKIYVSALRTCEEDGSRTYNDVLNGVVIDWDGVIHSNRYIPDTENEIDVLMMHGIIPVFISCKNGFVDSDELYKLETVASRFGGKYAKKVLVATALNENSSLTAHLRDRAKVMGIKIIEKIQDMSEEELQKTLRTLWTD